MKTGQICDSIDRDIKGREKLIRRKSGEKKEREKKVEKGFVLRFDSVAQQEEIALQKEKSG